MELKVSLNCIKLDFGTSFADFLEANISLYDSFSFRTKNIPTPFVFLLRKYGFLIGLGFFCISIKKCTSKKNNGNSQKISTRVLFFATELIIMNLRSKHCRSENTQVNKVSNLLDKLNIYKLVEQRIKTLF